MLKRLARQGRFAWRRRLEEMAERIGSYLGSALSVKPALHLLSHDCNQSFDLAQRLRIGKPNDQGQRARRRGILAKPLGKYSRPGVGKGSYRRALYQQRAQMNDVRRPCSDCLAGQSDVLKSVSTLGEIVRRDSAICPTPG